MRVRSIVSALLVLALPLTVLAGDGDKPAPDAKAPPAKAPPVKPAPDKAAAAKEKREADAPVVVPASLLRPAPKDLDEALRRMANVRVSVKFSDTPFTEVVEYIRRVAGFNVIVSPVLQNKGLDAIRPITMTLNDVSLRQLTELVGQFSATKFKLQDGVLQFTTPEDARGNPVLRIYSIGDLTMQLRNFPGPDMNLRPAHAEFEDEPESEVPNAWSDPQKIVDMIQKLCAEESWADKDVSISADENKLIVKQYPEVHRQIAKLIWMLRSAR